MTIKKNVSYKTHVLLTIISVAVGVVVTLAGLGITDHFAVIANARDIDDIKQSMVRKDVLDPQLKELNEKLDKLMQLHINNL